MQYQYCMIGMLKYLPNLVKSLRQLVFSHQCNCHLILFSKSWTTTIFAEDHNSRAWLYSANKFNVTPLYTGQQVYFLGYLFSFCNFINTKNSLECCQRCNLFITSWIMLHNDIWWRSIPKYPLIWIFLQIKSNMLYCTLLARKKRIQSLSYCKKLLNN